MEFDQRMKEARTRKGWTQRQLAEKAEVSPSAISSYESYGKMPPIDIAVRIAEALEVSLEWLCGVDGGTPKTAGDVARLLLRAESAAHCYFESREEGPVVVGGISFMDGPLAEFCAAYEKVLMNFQEEIIDDDIRRIWLERQLEKLDQLPPDAPF